MLDNAQSYLKNLTDTNQPYLLSLLAAEKRSCQHLTPKLLKTNVKQHITLDKLVSLLLLFKKY